MAERLKNMLPEKRAQMEAYIPRIFVVQFEFAMSRRRITPWK